jgi:hypothetical protein
MVVLMGALALLHIWCATQGRLKTPRVATISWFADKRFVLLPSLLFLSIILLHRILRHSYSISLYLELAREHSIQHSILGHSASSLYNRSRLPLFRHFTTNLLLLYDCLAMASLPFSLTRQEHPTKTNTSRIPPF